MKNIKYILLTLTVLLSILSFSAQNAEKYNGVETKEYIVEAKMVSYVKYERNGSKTIKGVGNYLSIFKFKDGSGNVYESRKFGREAECCQSSMHWKQVSFLNKKAVFKSSYIEQDGMNPTTMIIEIDFNTNLITLTKKSDYGGKEKVYHITKSNF